MKLGKAILYSVLGAFSWYRDIVKDMFIEHKAAAILPQAIMALKSFFIALIIIEVCIFLLVGGIALLTITVLSFAPWTAETKLLTGIFGGLAALFMGIGICFWLFHPKQWKKFFEIHMG